MIARRCHAALLQVLAVTDGISGCTLPMLAAAVESAQRPPPPGGLISGKRQPWLWAPLAEDLREWRTLNDLSRSDFVCGRVTGGA